MAHEDVVIVAQLRLLPDLDPGAVGRGQVDEVAVAVIAGVDLRVAAGHELVVGEDDVPFLATEDRASFGQAVDVLDDAADADLEDLEAAARSGAAHVAGAIAGLGLWRDGLLEALEAKDLAPHEEGIPRGELDLVAQLEEGPVEAVEVLDEQLALFDVEASVFGAQERVGGEAGVAFTTDGGLEELELDDDPVGAIFVDGDEEDLPGVCLLGRLGGRRWLANLELFSRGLGAARDDLEGTSALDAEAHSGRVIRATVLTGDGRAEPCVGLVFWARFSTIDAVGLIDVEARGLFDHLFQDVIALIVADLGRVERIEHEALEIDGVEVLRLGLVEARGAQVRDRTRASKALRHAGERLVVLGEIPWQVERRFGV